MPSTSKDKRKARTAPKLNRQIPTSALDRALPILKVLIITYAFLAGLRTIDDPDLGWQLATGRWIVQHGHIPSVDVLSYTAQGQPWIYPIGSELLLYFLQVIGGYAMLSLLGAAVCALTVWLLLRKGNIWSAVLAAVAVTVIADRTMPRAEMFTALLFAGFLLVLWQYHETGRAPLWSLPLLMLAWVNLHPGFIAGLALIAAYAGIELLEMMWPGRRQAAFARLRRSWVWLTAAALATLMNPWGWGIYRALARQQAAMKEHSYWIAEWAPLPLSWTAISSTFSLRGTNWGIYLLLGAALAGVIVAGWRGRFGAALLLAVAAWLDTRHLRYHALFAAVVVVIAGTVLAEAAAHIGKNFAGKRTLAVRRVAATLIALFVVFRVTDLVRGHDYLEVGERVAFGVGLSPQMPLGGARYLSRANLGRVFNTYDDGGFLSYAAGPGFLDYVDGRALPFGPQIITRSDDLTRVPPDSAEWQKEIAQYGIAGVILPLARYNVLEFFPALDQFCHSQVWKPVYLDEAAAVFVRRDDKRAFLLPPVDCATTPIPAVQPTGTDRNAFDHWVNASAVLRSLGRNSEARAGNEKALAMFPTSAYARWNQAVLFAQMGNFPAAEEQYRLAAAYDPSSPLIWADLGYLYEDEHRLPEAVEAWEHAARLTPPSWRALLPLGYVYLEAHRPEDARAAFDELSRSLPSDPRSVLPARVLARLARGRAAIASALGDSAAAQSFEEQAYRLDPGSAADWQELAHLYASYGGTSDAQRANARAEAIAGNAEMH